MSVFSCCATVPYAQCETVAISLDNETRGEADQTVLLGDTVQLSSNAAGYVIEGASEGYVTLVVPGATPQCVTLTLVTDAARYFIGQPSGPLSSLVVINVHITKSTITPAPLAWSQTIQYSAPAVPSGNTLVYAAGTTQLTVDLLPGTYRCFAEITVGAATEDEAYAAVHARLNITTARMT